MNVPPLKQATRATVDLVPQIDLDGSVVVVVLIKQRFHVDPRGRVRRVPGAEVTRSDVPWDEDAPETSSIRLPCDVCIRKPSTDVVVAGSAIAKHGEPVRELDVFVRVGPVERTLRVHGVRVWYRGLAGLTTTKPLPFESLPLRWEYAWGGADFSDPKRPLEEARNPVGRGMARNPAELDEKPAPQIEDPSEPITSPRQRPQPAGVAPIGRHWLPRRQYVGTTDRAWMRDRMPLLPADFDDRFNQVAPPPLIAPRPLRGGEPVQVVGMSAAGALQFVLPRVEFFVGARVGQSMTEHSSQLDTVLLLPNQAQLDLTWRALVPFRRGARIDHVQVHEKAVR